MTVAIDLGTTHSLISIWKDELSHLIRNEKDTYLTPSVISIGNDDQIIIGEKALKWRDTNFNFHGVKSWRP